ncbi:DNA (cytosine-5)-methyltransferase 1 [Spiroplasma sp. TIUS-1]|uniref:DNA (cytosine-5-)-methyltransferase n=1 Tax=Spiroplasma sp. TIUS-1 TaxID=216963 RepID=UPI0013992160|nr:DNA (cytosine-5-)-methyltransferase [Spiroplasma sp. TIUS-1]QHX35755.1 DNA (cytosine-5)-methyltransferase 1 [Spiroplasma sp. TIUS-1]
MGKIRFIDLFAGIGGFHKALEKTAAITKDDIECVFVSEIDKESIKTYSGNFNIDKEKIINIRNVDSECSQVPDHDFLFAGFPCQTFSNAGNKKGFLDEIRGTLFFDIAKILHKKKPKYILLENVKHLVNHDNGKTWKIIIEKLIEIGYMVPDVNNPLILSPHQFGIPQDRKRVFIPGYYVGPEVAKNESLDLDFSEYNQTSFNLNYSEPMETKKYIWDNFLEKNVSEEYYLNEGSYLVKVFDAWNEFLKNVKRNSGRTLPVIWASEFGKNYDISDLPNWRKKYISDMREIYKNNKNFIDAWIEKYNVLSWKKREQKFEWQAGVDMDDIHDSFIQLRQSGIRCKRPIKFPTLVAMVQIPIVFEKGVNKWRYLTPGEVGKLQSFPTDYKNYVDIEKNSNNFYAYKQFGNSVNVEIVSIIQQELIKKVRFKNE